MTTKSRYGVLASELIELIKREYKDDEIIGFNLYGKSDIEIDLDCKITDDQWETFLKSFVEDDNLNEVRAMAWEDALQAVRDEIEE